MSKVTVAFLRVCVCACMYACPCGYEVTYNTVLHRAVEVIRKALSLEQGGRRISGGPCHVLLCCVCFFFSPHTSMDVNTLQK